MSDNTPHIIQLLRRWLSGNIRAAEEQELDRAAEDDPFLRDALDGYRQHPEADHEAATDRIRGKLDERRRRSGGGFIRWLPRAVAAAVVLLLIGATLWFLNIPGGGDTAALSEREITEPRQVEPLEPEVAAEETETAAEEDGPSLEPAAAPEAGARAPREEKPAPITPPPPKAESEEALTLETRPEAEAPAEAPPPSESIDRFSEIADTPAPAAARRALSEAPEPDTTVAARRLIGQVTTAGGDPVRGAQIQLPGAGFGTMTDSGGRFQMNIPARQDQLLINPAGNAAALVRLDQSEVVNITLEESDTPAGREGVAKRLAPPLARTEAARAIVWPPPLPEGGFEALEKHIDANRQYPDTAAAAGQEGTVHLQFTVEPGGELTHFNVLESPGEALSREAIRLLREGPTWRLPEGRSSPMLAAYRVEFKR